MAGLGGEPGGAGSTACRHRALLRCRFPAGRDPPGVGMWGLAGAMNCESCRVGARSPRSLDGLLPCCPLLGGRQKAGLGPLAPSCPAYETSYEGS